MTLKEADPKLIYKDESYAIVGSCFAVYKDKSCGFLESVYRECLEIEFERQQIPGIPKPQLELEYKGRKLKQRFFPDFICYQTIVLELKALPQLTEEERQRVADHIRKADPSYDSVLQALQVKK